MRGFLEPILHDAPARREEEVEVCFRFAAAFYTVSEQLGTCLEAVEQHSLRSVLEYVRYLGGCAHLELWSFVEEALLGC